MAQRIGNILRSARSLLGRITPRRSIIAAALTLTAAGQARAETTNVRPRLVVPPQVTVSAPEIKLGAIARISHEHSQFDTLVEKLAAVSLGEAPPPTMRATIPGVRILAAIQEAGIPADAIGYSIPTAVLVERSGRTLSNDEVLPHVRAELAKDPDLDLQVREINWAHAQVIPGGRTSFAVERLGRPEGGKLPLRISVTVDDNPAARFLATAIVDDWREVPVMKKTLERGMLIAADDVELVRMNLFRQPANVADNVGEVVGRRAKQRLAAGETIKKNLIDIPPVVPVGKTVTMLFRSGGLEATATGTAMEDGFEDSIIKIKNDSSRRIVKARVINPEQVEVSAQ